MTENRDRASWTLDEEAEHQLELAEQRRQWEQRRQAEAEQREREVKQARLETYLKSRSEAYLDYTGSPPPQHVLEGWQLEYLSERKAEEQRKRDAAIEAYERDMGF